VDQELLLRNEYLSTENRILRAQLKGRLALSDAEQAELADIGFRLGRKALAEVATAAPRPPSWLGIDGSSPATSTEHRHVERPADHRSTETSRN
jgi:hypothetical protein